MCRSLITRTRPFKEVSTEDPGVVYRVPKAGWVRIQAGGKFRYFRSSNLKGAARYLSRAGDPEASIHGTDANVAAVQAFVAAMGSASADTSMGE